MTDSTQLDHGDIDITDIEQGGFRGTCQWQESVCTASPEAYITYAEESEVFCLRHYTLTLSYTAEVHVPSCSHTLAQHITRFGRLSDD